MRLAAVLVLGCSARTATTESAVTSRPPAPTCHDPPRYGAVPGDGASDRVAFQAALNAAAATPDGGTLCVGPGRWTLERRLVGSYNRFAALSTHGRNVTIAGAGPETVLELAGDQGAGDTTVISIDPGAEGVVIRDLTIDTTAATNTSEQTHAIATSGTCSGVTCLPISDLEIRDVTFRHPRTGTGRKGDCIRLLGSTEATRVDRVRIEGSSFVSCARNGITIQRNVHALVIMGNTFAATTDTDIDSEPTGGGTNTGIVIAGNVFRAGPESQGDYAVTLGGAPGGPMTSVAVTGNVFHGRGIRLYRTAITTIAGNTIAAKMTTGDGVIDVSNVCSGLVISGNTVTRTGAPGPLVRLAPHSGSLCSGVIASHNAMTQGTPAFGIHMESASDVSIDGNALTWTVAAPQFSAIYARATAPVSRLSITGNRIFGPVTYGVTLDASPASFGAGIRVVGNTADGPTTGLRCKGAFGPIVSYGNAMGPRSCPVGTVFLGGD
jgi:hypothetical protein